MRWQNRAQFLAIAAQLMGRILVDYARSRRYLKRGGRRTEVSLEEAAVLSREPGSDLVALDDALTSLTEIDRRKSQIVELKFFGGLTTEETAQALKVSSTTIERDWTLARAWLHRAMSKSNRGKTRNLAANQRSF